MALQTKTFKSSTTSNGFNLQLTLTEDSTSQTNNTSKISYTLKLYSGGWDFSQYKIGHSISLAGNTVSSVARANANQYSISTNSSITLASGSTTITHNSDGNKNMSIAFSIDMAKDSWTPGAISVSGESMALTFIPRASTISCSAAYIGSSATIIISRASSSFTHTLSYAFGNLTGTIATKTSNASVNFALPTTFYAQIPNAKSGTGTITCDTYNGSTKIGTKTCTFTAKCSESACKPTISGTAVDTNQTTIALTGSDAKFVKYYSNASVSSSASARNNATLSGQKITCGSKSISSNSGSINGVDSGTFTFSATDSRGYTTTQTLNKTLINYIKLTCTIASQAATTSGVAKINVSGNYWDGNFGAVANTLTVQYRYKTNGEAYSNWINSSATISKSNNTYSTTIDISGLDYLNTYTFQARAIDKLATIESNAQATKTKPIFDWGSDDFNFNVSVAAPSLSTGDLTTNGEVEIYGDQPHLNFHFGNSSGDYTTRIIETASGKLNLSAPSGVEINGKKADTESVTLTVLSNRLTGLTYTAKYSQLLGVVFVRIYGTVNVDMTAGTAYNVLSIDSHKSGYITPLTANCNVGCRASARNDENGNGVIAIVPTEAGIRGKAVYIAGFWFAA